MRFRRTIGEILWPNPQEFLASLEGDQNAASTQLLDLVWKGYDIMAAELGQIDLTQPLDDIERSLTELLERRIRQLMSGFEPFDVQHGPYERETRRPAPAQPPQYDLAFILRANERVMWPLEAKVLPRALSEYIADVQNEFLTCRYGPFSAEGGMLGYVLGGDTEGQFRAIASGIPATLTRHPTFTLRAHRTSDHRRAIPQGKSYPADFRVHHLLLAFASPVACLT